MNNIMNKKPQFIRKLRQWYRKHHRSYPWRNTKNPYKILISEFLLQKTNADLALATYKNLVKNYPNPKSLASAIIDKLKRLISPLAFPIAQKG